MNEKQMPKCPGCGNEMYLMGPSDLGLYCYDCRLVGCGWRSPKRESPEAAYDAAMIHYVEPNRVLTLDETCATLVRMDPIWLEIRGVCGGSWFGNGDEVIYALNEFHPDCDEISRDSSEWDAEYGKSWRCWVRRPTDEERVTIPWER